MLPAELQNTFMEQKFAQIKEQRQDARNVLREAKQLQPTRNQQSVQQILLLMQAMNGSLPSSRRLPIRCVRCFP